MVLMNSRTVLSKSRQAGFTLVEIVAVTVIVTILAAYAIPRMMGPGEFAVRAAADRLVAALHYAQTLAQRQGNKIEVVIQLSDPQITVKKQGGAVVLLPNEVYDDYRVRLHSEVSITPSDTITYDLDGIPTSLGGVTIPAAGKSFYINENGVKRYTVTVQPTGFVQLGS